MPETKNSPSSGEHVSFRLTELAERSGVAARTIRFYATEGLLDAPTKIGRDAVYHPQHLVTLELIRELQSHGFGLAAIKEHLKRIPADASTGSIALHSTMLAPWLADRPEIISSTEFTARAGRDLTADDVSVLTHLGVVTPVPADPSRIEVATALLSLALELLDAGLTPTSAAAIGRAIDQAGTQLTAQLGELYTQHVRPVMTEKQFTDADVGRFVALFKPISIAAVARSYEHALTELRDTASLAAQTTKPTDTTQGA